VSNSYQRVVRAIDLGDDVPRPEALLRTGALQSAIFNSANFSSIAAEAPFTTAIAGCRACSRRPAT